MRIENRLPGFAQCPRIAGLLVLTLVVFLTGLMSALTPQRAEAIPAFARKYSVSCMTCHVAFPQLNSFGRERRHGIASDGPPRPRYHQSPAGPRHGPHQSRFGGERHAAAGARTPQF